MEPVNKVITSQHARVQWRELLENAVRGNTVVITHYGRPVAVLIPYYDCLANVFPEPVAASESPVTPVDVPACPDPAAFVTPEQGASLR
jgi:prevent-host-death family protein